jgi:hypothetical protein
MVFCKILLTVTITKILCSMGICLSFALLISGQTIYFLPLALKYFIYTFYAKSFLVQIN